jgi:hypothetical protein
MHKLMATKTALHKAIDHIDGLLHGKERVDDFSIQGIPHAELSFRIALASAVGRQRPTCVLSESFSPDQVALHLLCFQARIALADVAAQRLDEVGIARLNHAAARISASPLHLAMCAPFDIEEIAWELLSLIHAGNVQVVVCERRTAENLDGWRAELEFLSKTGSAEVHLLAGQISVTSRFTANLEQMV